MTTSKDYLCIEVKQAEYIDDYFKQLIESINQIIANNLSFIKLFYLEDIKMSHEEFLELRDTHLKSVSVFVSDKKYLKSCSISGTIKDGDNNENSNITLFFSHFLPAYDNFGCLLREVFGVVTLLTEIAHLIKCVLEKGAWLGSTRDYELEFEHVNIGGIMFKLAANCMGVLPISKDDNERWLPHNNDIRYIDESKATEFLAHLAEFKLSGILNPDLLQCIHYDNLKIVTLSESEEQKCISELHSEFWIKVNRIVEYERAESHVDTILDAFKRKLLIRDVY